MSWESMLSAVGTLLGSYGFLFVPESASSSHIVGWIERFLRAERFAQHAG